MRAFGGELPVTYHPLTNQWSALFDSRIEYQGQVQITLQVRDLAGCLSLPVLLSLIVNNTLERGARWSEKALDAPVCAEMLAKNEVISHVGYYARVLPVTAPDAGRYFRWYVKSPDPGAATSQMLSDNAAMKNRVLPWQDVALNDVTRLIKPAAAGATSPDHTARLCMESVAVEVMNLFNLNAARVIKIRQTQADEVEILTSASYLKFGKDGLSTLCTFASYNVTGTVTDGARLGNKIYLSRENSNRVVVLDTVIGKVAGEVEPFAETRPVTALESWGGAIFALYSGPGGATGYVLEGASFDDPFVTSFPLRRAWVRGAALYLASDTEILKAGASGLETVRAVTSPATAWQVFTSETGGAGIGSESELGLQSGAAFLLDGITSVPLASGLGGAVADLGRFKGASPAPRGALIVASGANVSKLFLARNGIYEPRWTLRDLAGNVATKSVALANVLVTLRPATGDVLKGGDAGLFSEQLLIAFETSAGAYLARIQEADVDASKAVRGRAVIDQNFKRVRAIKRAVTGTSP